MLECMPVHQRLDQSLQRRKHFIEPILLANRNETLHSFIHSVKRGAILVREIEVIIDTEEIAEFFFQELVKRGYVPNEEELEELADITFEYLLDKCIIDEEVENE